MTEQNAMPTTGTILVVGGGIAGLTTALEASEAGHEVHLIEKKPYLGGRVAQLNRYFPKLCPPYCGLEINFRRLRQNPRVHIWTQAEVTKVEGEAGNLDVEVSIAPRYVNERCTGCNDCVAACPVERDDDFNYGLAKTKAIYLPHAMAHPQRYVIDDSVCTLKECGKCVPTCKYDAIDLEMVPKTMTLKVGAVVYATGWQPYDASKLEDLGFGDHANVITNVMMERLAAVGGPTGGKITRPSDGKEPSHVVFVQCAGSRDENHLPFCSAVCCLASLKQATYVREALPEAKVHMFYIDVRAPGRFEDFYTKVEADDHVTLSRGKVAKISEIPDTGNLVVEAENTLTGEKLKVETELVVLATGMQPTQEVPPGMTRDEAGFAQPDLAHGVVVAGCGKKPADVATTVQDATGAALRAVQTARRAFHG